MKARFDAILLILLFCLCTASAELSHAAGAETASAEAKLEETLERLEARMSAVQTLQSGFVEEKRLAVLEKPLVLKGRICMEKPARLAWHVEEPLRYSLVIRDEVVRQWDEDTGRVQTLSLSKNPALQMVLQQMRSWFSGAYRSLIGEYEVTVVGEAPLALRFVPREGGFAKAAIESVTIVFESDERYIHEMRIAEKGGDETLLTFVQPVLNAPIDPSAWQVGPHVR